MRPGNLSAALALIGRGEVASVVGRLRPDMVGIDIDASGALGDLAKEAVRDWSRAHGLWHLVRASGGGPGRWHIFVVAGVMTIPLQQLLDDLRREQRLSTSALGTRTEFRPLSAPHRRTGQLSPLPDDVASVLADLRSVLDTAPTRPLPRSRRRSSSRRVTPVSGELTPLGPLPRPRRSLPEGWAAYLGGGRAAAAAAGLDRDPATRSQLELEATTQLVIAGLDEDEAWATIQASHRTAFTKSKQSGRRWWWWIWNRAVADADAWLAERRRVRAQAPRADQGDLVSASIKAARRALDGAWRSWPVRTRHIDREVLHVVLDRMDRIGSTAVAIPQRDLVLDCAVASRTTVRVALQRLQTAGFLEVLPTYRPGTTDSSHTLSLAADLYQRMPTKNLEGRPLSLDTPSRFQPPLPSRRTLGLRCTAVLTHLPDRSSPEGFSLLSIASAAGLLDDPDADDLTAAQRRTVTAHLRTLAAYDLAGVDEHGHWRAADRATSPVLEQIGATLDQHVRDEIAAERSEFREKFDAGVRRARWERQRDAAIARSTKSLLAAQKAWWGNLDPVERRTRRTARTARFAALPPAEQAALKTHLAQTRRTAGEPDERTRYTTWRTSLPAAEFDARSAERTRLWLERTPDQQKALVSDWVAHRARWNLPRHHRPPVAATPPAVPGAPEGTTHTTQPTRRRDQPDTHLDAGQLELQLGDLWPGPRDGHRTDQVPLLT